MVGQVRRGEHSAIGRALHRIAVEAQAADHERERLERRRGRGRVVQRDALLLQVAVVRERQALQRGEHGDEVADDPAGAAAHELGDVGVLLLRHDARPGRVLVGELGEAELGAGPQHELLGQTRCMHRGERARVRELRDEVAIGDGVDAVAERPGELQLFRDGGGIDRIRHAGERAGAERRDRRARSRASAIRARSRRRSLDVREQVMRERDRLRALEVRVAGQHGVDLGLGALDERQRERFRRTIKVVEQLDDEQAQVERDLIVPAARGVQLAADRVRAAP